VSAVHRWAPTLLILAPIVLCPSSPAAAAVVDETHLRAAVEAGDWKQIQAMGPGALPALVRLYEASPEAQRATIASIFYSLGWKSPEAKRALMKDARTPDQALRLQVQWALGRVSDDPDVVDVLLDNMRNDAQPLFRDKAACALAHDQIHLSPLQKVRLFDGLIAALDDPKAQVRQIALQALQILTGQTKGYSSMAAPEERRRAVEAWRQWLEEYRAHL
jgi:HEAT repeat protein